MKKIVAPDYYRDFKCLSDQCSFTCCQEWKIGVDDETAKRIQEACTWKDGQRVIRFNEQRRCPFLNKNQLCDLVLKRGDTAISTTCQLYPRKEKEFLYWRECSLDAGCPELVDQLQGLSTIDFHLEAVNNIGTQHGIFQMRNWFLEIIQHPDNSLEESMLIIFYLSLEGMDHSESMIQNKDAMVQAVKNAIREMKFSWENTCFERNELFLDFIENYQREGLYKSFLKDISKEAERIANEESAIEEMQWNRFLQEMSEYHVLLRNVVANEIFISCMNDEDDWEDVVVKLQWIAMEYSILVHTLFLQWRLGQWSYENIRETIVIISRMAGFDDDSIYEYLENSFQELIWDWGYFALLVFSS